MKIWINLTVAEEDSGEGGVGRVVRAQREWFPKLGHELVDDPAQADVLAWHMFADGKVMERHPEKPMVAHCHGLYWSEYEWPRWSHKANLNVIDSIGAADVTTVPSEWVANAVRRHTSRETVVIPHGVDLEEWTPAEPHESRFILWDKNRPDPVCDPKPMNTLAQMLPAMKFVSTFGEQAPNVNIVGSRSYAEAKEIAIAAYIYLATTRETFGISILQAMAAGVPVVGWDWGGQREFLGAGGILVRPGDFDALVEAIKTVGADRETWSQAARGEAERIGGWRSHMEAYIRTYERAIQLSDRTGPRVSIVVPAYGLEKYLPDTLDSVLAQTDDDWECIVVDDASPDRCGEIADEYSARDSRIKVIHNETNQYLAGARNTGISAATGRHILPLDADDMLTPRAVQTLADALDADRLLHVAYGGVMFVQEDGTTPSVYPKFEKSPGHSGWPMAFNFEWQSYERNLLPYSSMFRRRAWELTGGYRTRCRTAEDADFWLRLSSYGFRPAQVTTADTLIYRNRDGSMSREEGPVEWSRWFPHGAQYRRRPPAGWTVGFGGGSFAPQGNPDHSDIPSLDPSAVAVIIPVGPGHEGIVRDAIDSVAAQTWEQWECIVVNDSGNNLGPLPQWVRVMETPAPSSGVAVARNVGIAASSSTWFLPLDADDLLEPTSLETWIGVGAQHPGEVIYSDFYEDPIDEGTFKIYEAPDYDPQSLIRGGCLHIVTALTPRAIWEEVGGYPTGTAWEDWGFQLETAARGFCSRRIARPLVTYRKHAGSRRDENFGAFEQSKSEIKDRYGEYWDGGKTLMACKGCPSGQASTIAGKTSQGARQQRRSAALDGMELLEYQGPKTGTFSIKGASGQVYRVQPKRAFYVQPADVSDLVNRGYRRQKPTTLEAPPVTDVPTLSAPGKPAPVPVQTPLPDTTDQPTTKADPEPAKCIEMTKAGTRCRNNCEDGREYCKKHPRVAVTA